MRLEKLCESILNIKGNLSISNDLDSLEQEGYLVRKPYNDNDIMNKLYELHYKGEVFTGYIVRSGYIFLDKKTYDNLYAIKSERAEKLQIHDKILEYVLKSAEKYGFQIERNYGRRILVKDRLKVILLIQNSTLFITAKLKFRNKKFYKASIDIANPDLKHDTEIILEYISKKVEIAEFFYKGIEMLESNKSHELNFDPGIVNWIHSEMKDREFI